MPLQTNEKLTEQLADTQAARAPAFQETGLPAGRKVLLRACNCAEDGKHVFLSTKAFLNSTVVDLHINDDTTHMVWTKQQVSDSRFRLRNHAGKYLSVQAEGDQVHLIDINDDSGQQHWYFWPQGNGCFILTMFREHGNEGNAEFLVMAFTTLCSCIVGMLRSRSGSSFMWIKCACGSAARLITSPY